jgi:glycolate oxidase iron-sulfur subunit
MIRYAAIRTACRFMTSLTSTLANMTTMTPVNTTQNATPALVPPPALSQPHVRDLYSQCIHCGLCLPACPTYSVFQTEMDNPRGRIQLITAAAEGRIAVDGPFQEHLELCLGCRACETACPSGVQYGALYELAREAIEEQRQISRTERFVRDLALRRLLPHRTRLRLMARGLWLYQRLGLQGLARHIPFLPPMLRTMEELTPPLSAAFPDYSHPAPAVGDERGEVALLYGCVQDAFLSSVNTATVRVLQRNGYAVHFPQGQSCCGAAPLHIGEGEIARELARRNIDACLERDFVAIISNAGGCGATLKHYDQLLQDDPAYAAKAKAFVAKLQDVSEFLAANLHMPPTGTLNLRVTYVDSCHLRHGQKVVRQPRQLLQSIPGLHYVELKQPDMCCGSAGVYNIMQQETATQVLDAKMQDVTAARPDVVVTTNTGCHMQMIQGVRQAGLQAEVLHVVELLDRAYFAAAPA